MSKSAKRDVKRVVKAKVVYGEDDEETQSAAALIQSSTAERAFDGTFAPGRRVALTKYDGRDLIHVREYVRDEEREYPSKVGACFTPARLRALMCKIEEIDEQLRQQNANSAYMVDQGEVTYKTHLGAGIYASVNSRFNGVDLRRFWIPPGQLMTFPTKNGIYLPSSQWRALKLKLEELIHAHPEIVASEGCFHQNQMEALDCRECMPFGFLCV